MSDSLLGRVVAALDHQYAIDEEIGRGGMSIVYRARDLRLNRPVAIKILPPELAYDPAIRTRFTREAQTSAQLTHPNIVPIYDVGEREGIAYFVMALVSGGNLAAHLAREPRPPVEQTRRVVREIADALDYAHQHGVVHRDIKPDNVLLDADSGRAVVTDFGIARAIEGGSRLTVTGIAVGTPAYMSPEQAVGERELDGRSDVYSLGIVAYQMLTGRVPFVGANSMALLLKHVHDTPRPIAELRPETPRGMREAVERALVKDVEDRWPTAGALRDALSATATPPPWRSEPREPTRYVSPRRGTPAAEALPRVPQAGRSADGTAPAPDTGIVLEPTYLASLTPAQRADLRLWNGRVNLFDRVKAMRGYTLLTAAAFVGGMGAFAAGVSGEAPPFVLAPLVPLYMSIRLWLRARSLRAAGLRLRRVFLMPRAKWVIPAPARPAGELELQKLVPRALLESPQGVVIRRAFADRAAIAQVISTLAKVDRALLPDLDATVKALFERVVQLAEQVQALDGGMDWRMADRLDRRIRELEAAAQTPEAARQLGLIRRQRATFQELVQRRSTLLRQLESATLALGSLHLDLIKFRSSGLQSSLSDVSTATQEARALSRDIDAALAAAVEVRGLDRG